MKPEIWLETLNCAVEGIIHAVRTQRHMRWHSLACLAVLVVAPRFSVTPVEFALLCLAAGVVVVAELLNTAIEATVDLASPDYHPMARAAKDVAAGAVLVASFAAVAVGWVVFYPRLEVIGEGVLEGLDRGRPILAASIVLAVLVAVILAKAVLGKGRPLRGGLPSGHAAVAFAICTLLALQTRDIMVVILSGVLATMVSHSRLLHRIHTHLEVALGALLGVVLSALLFWLVR